MFLNLFVCCFARFVWFVVTLFAFVAMRLIVCVGFWLLFDACLYLLFLIVLLIVASCICFGVVVFAVACCVMGLVSCFNLLFCGLCLLLDLVGFGCFDG